MARIGSTDRGIPRPAIEIHCEQIFQRASSINKDLIHRMQNAPIAKKQVFGFDIKKIWILATLLILFSFSLVGAILFWLTNSVDTYILQNLMLVNGTEMYSSWTHPKAKAYMKVHIFNYTNVEDLEKGEKLKVKDLGPYVYEESVARQNVYFDKDGTVTYQNVFKHKFIPHLSKGKPNDVVVVPNIMMMATAYKTQDLDLWARLAASMTLGGFMNQKPFMKIAAHRYIWGYDDSVYDLAKGFLAFQSSNVQDQIGLMSQRNGTSPFVMTVNTGQRGMKNFGVIRKVNGFDNIGHWTGECDSFTGSDGSLFPPADVRSKKNLGVYFPELCRKYNYVFDKEVFIINNAVPAYRYKMAKTAYDSADSEPSNRCFCDPGSGVCPPQGFYNATSCTYGAPMLISHPHFARVNPSDIKVDGINRKQQNYESYVDLHPTMGFPIAGMTRMQINIFAKRYAGFLGMDMFDADGIILPVAWMESGLEDKDITGEYLDTIYMTSITIKQIEMAIKYITLLTTVITGTAIFIILKAIVQSYKNRRNLQPVTISTTVR